MYGTYYSPIGLSKAKKEFDVRSTLSNGCLQRCHCSGSHRLVPFTCTIERAVSGSIPDLNTFFLFQSLKI